MISHIWYHDIIYDIMYNVIYHIWYHDIIYDIMYDAMFNIIYDIMKIISYMISYKIWQHHIWYHICIHSQIMYDIIYNMTISWQNHIWYHIWFCIWYHTKIMLPRSAAGAPPARRGRQKPRADADAPRNDGGRSMLSALPRPAPETDVGATFPSGIILEEVYWYNVKSRDGMQKQKKCLSSRNTPKCSSPASCLKVSSSTVWSATVHSRDASCIQYSCISTAHSASVWVSIKFFVATPFDCSRKSPRCLRSQSLVRSLKRCFLMCN